MNFCEFEQIEIEFENEFDDSTIVSNDEILFYALSSYFHFLFSSRFGIYQIHIWIFKFILLENENSNILFFFFFTLIHQLHKSFIFLKFLLHSLICKMKRFLMLFKELLIILPCGKLFYILISMKNKLKISKWRRKKNFQDKYNSKSIKFLHINEKWFFNDSMWHKQKSNTISACFIFLYQTEKFLIFLQNVQWKKRKKKTANSLQANVWIDERLAKILRDYVPSFPL